MSRLDTANALKLAASLYFAKKMFGVYNEVGVIRYGKRRADVLGINMKGQIVICEVKSCRADYVSDKKVLDYLPYCNKLYLVVKEADWESWLCKMELDKRVGVIVLQTSGLCRVVKSCRGRSIEFGDLYFKLAWKGSTYNKGNSRMRRVYV